MSCASDYLLQIARELDAARDLASQITSGGIATDSLAVENLGATCDRARDIAYFLYRAHDRAVNFTFRFGGPFDLTDVLASACASAENLISDLEHVLDSATKTAVGLADLYVHQLDLAAKDTDVLVHSIGLATTALMNLRYPLGDPTQEAVESTSGHARPAKVVRSLARTATRVLPVADRPRYGDEYQSELYELVVAGASWWAQLIYAVRLIDQAWVLRAELREAALRRARS